ncbi:MAG TPA: rhodanese-like domain-containing protein [Acidobacteriaceae bacterium]|nr:rhodanese-like domain-containing protein [Acidobacteriaceae bacterium]
MSWIEICVALAVIALFFVLKKSGQASVGEAQSQLRSGALLIDVRSPSEYRSGHLPSAINLPLNRLEAELPRRVPDKDQPLLLHCQSGMRSGTAKKKLAGMGYRNVFNLGSYSRAAQVVREK